MRRIPSLDAGGIGGIAMPGMAAKSSAPPEPDPAPAPAWSRPGRTPEPRDRRRSTPSPEKLESPPASPQKASVRERTMSTPTGPKNGPIFSPQPTRDTTESRSNSTTSHSNGFGAPGTSRALTSGQSTPASSPPSKSPVVTPSLSRPIQPDPRTSPQGPQISMSQSPSLAFLRPPPQKDPTPSLSRLKGRGFVQNMVKVSSQLQSPAPPSPSIERPRSTSGRKPSVLDRWPSPAPAASPPPSPTAAPMRRSRTVDTPATTAPSSARAVPISKSYSDTGKAKVDEPSRSGQAYAWSGFCLHDCITAKGFRRR
ncbi:hypothetical protein B0H14DRAFT_1263487 [Mycena olivaceomarginata]|nr:hypothetical protein B0H14DRAFT_1263487 [Mycena olivaceomarginata]